MNTTRRLARVRYAIVVGVAALVSFTANGLGATGTVSPRLVGTWTRKVTSADIKRAHVPQTESGEVFPGAVYTLTLQKNGTARLLLGQGQNGEHWTGPIVPAGANRVHINLPFAFPNTYRWRVTGRQLTFTLISDSDRTVRFRAAVFGGVWKRK